MSRTIFFCSKFLIPPEHQIRRVAVLPELREMHALPSPHGLNHLLGQLHRRRQRLGIMAEHVGKVHVEQPPVRGEEEVLQVSVADAEDVSHHAVGGWNGFTL